jgi:hypothetical protein
MMSDGTTAANPLEALGDVLEFAWETPSALSRALYELYSKFLLDPRTLWAPPETKVEGQPALEPGKGMEVHGNPYSPADSLRLDWLNELPEVEPSLECCSQITEAIGQLTTAVKEIEACCKPAAEAPTADIHKRMDEIERDIRRASKPSPIDEILGWEALAGVFSDLSAHVLKLGATLSNFRRLDMAGSCTS